MSKTMSLYLILASTMYLVSCKSYQTPSTEQNVSSSSSFINGDNDEDLDDLMEAFLDINGGEEEGGHSDNNPLGPFGEVIKRLREEREKRRKGSQDITSPVQTTDVVPRDSGSLTSEAQDHDSPGLMNFAKDGNTKLEENNRQEDESSVENHQTTKMPPTTTPRPTPVPIRKPNIKRKQFIMTSDDVEGGRPSGEPVTEEEMKALFINSGRGSSVMIPGCELTHFHVKSRCAGNLLELTLLSRNPLRGQVRLLEGDGQIAMEGTNLVVYGVLGPLTPSGNLWKLKKEVLKDELQRDCYICENMNVRVVLKVGEATCGMAVTCLQKGSTKVLNMEEKFARAHEDMDTTPTPPSSPVTNPSLPAVSRPGPNLPQGGGEAPIEDPGNTAKTTMTLTYSQDMVGTAVSGMVPIGTRMSLVLSVYSRDVTLDLHVVKCHAKGDDGRGVLLVKDGCSASSVMGEFREVLSIVQESSFGSHTVRRVSQFAELRAFNFRRSPQNITLICTIKMCGGECTERPSCVASDINLGRSTRPPVPIFTQEVTLGKVFHVGGLPLEPSSDISGLMLDTEQRNPNPHHPPTKYPDDCITRQTVIVLLAFVTSIYLGILLLCIYCVRRSAAKTVKEHYMEDYESPPKALFSEYNSPRRRTTPQQTSPAHTTTFSINSESGRSTPSSCGSVGGYQRIQLSEERP